MWDGLLLLLVLGIVMGTASFFAGILPLALALSPRQVRLITALGTGVLVGTALIVIIPEGVETVYSASGGSRAHPQRSVAARGLAAVRPAAPAGSRVWPRAPVPRAPAAGEEHPGLRSGPDDGFPAAPHAAHPHPPSAGPAPGPGAAGGAPHDSPAAAGRDPHAWIGTSVILGFILMYLIDTLPQHASPPSQPPSFHVSLNQFSLNRRSVSHDASRAPAPDTFAGPASDPCRHASRPASTTIGLVIHAAADGIALGASSTASGHLRFVIFMALMIHKAPAAFGLTSVLLKQGLSKRMARAHLIVFSLAAPVAAVLTFLGVHLLDFAGSFGEPARADFATGVLLLFSGGTFLYVAMHTMQDDGPSGPRRGEPRGVNGYAAAPPDDPYANPTPVATPPAGPHVTETLVTVGGMLLPLVTQWGRAH